MKWIAVALFVIAVAGDVIAQQPAAPAAGEVFIRTATCRLLDTGIAPNGAPQPSRSIDVRSTRCSHMIPSFATAYAVRLRNYSHLPPEQVPASDVPVLTVARMPVTADPLQFAVPPGRNLVVDIEGYFAPQGVPVAALAPSSQSTTGASLPKSAMTMAGEKALIPGTNTQLQGSTSTVHTDPDYSNYGWSAMVLEARSASGVYPFVNVHADTSDNAAGFLVYNGNGGYVMAVRGSGETTIQPPYYISGRTEYLGATENGISTIYNNSIHDVTIADPRDAAGGATAPVAFFNARSDSENGSPTVTKFRAYTNGSAGQSNINFDSQVSYHTGQYHFRGFSVGENKETFWVRANGTTSTTNTRADMYVSGNVGVGTPSPSSLSKLDVVGTDSSLFSRNSANGAYTFLGYSDAGGYGRIGSYLLGSGWKDLVMEEGGGNVGIGLLHPAAKLHVAGDTRVDGNLTVNGNIVNSTQLQSGTSGLVVNTGGTATGRLLSGIPNWMAMTSNARWNGAGFVEDDTTLPGWYAAVYSGSPNDGFSVWRMPPGPNPHADYRAMLSIRAAADGSPRVGIGVDQVDYALRVVGNVQIDGTLTGTNVQAQYQDVAEWVPASTAMTAGTVVVLNASKTNEVMASFRPYDTSVAGVVSARPGVILGTASPSKAQIATTGRVRVRVDATNHPVAIGDLLVTSEKRGMAMVSQPIDLGGVKIHRPGTLIGKALEPLACGEGEILVLLSLQ